MTTYQKKCGIGIIHARDSTWDRRKSAITLILGGLSSGRFSIPTRDAFVNQEGDTVTTSPAGNKLPNINGFQDTSPRHSLGYTVQHRVRTTIASILAALLVFAGTAAAATWLDVDGIIKSNSVNVIGQGSLDANTSIIDPNSGQPIEFVLIGQDSRDGTENQAIGGSFDDVIGNHQADTTMIVQISADRKEINLVSIPRDSLVDVPQCETTKGKIPAQYNVMFNSIFANAYQTGGDLASAASCTLNAVNSLTGLNIQNFIVVDFAGLVKMIDAVGGVDLCIPQNVDDPYTGLKLDKGLHHLDGVGATQYARTRHGLGDGSDTSRTTRQQYLIKQLMSEALSKNLFTDTAQLYQLAKSALKSLNISQGMADTAALAGLAMSLKDFSMSNLQTQTVPVVQASSDPNRSVWTDEADTLWEKMRDGKPIFESTDSSSTDTNTDSTPDSSDSTEDNNQSDGTGNQSPAETPDPNTGLITRADGTLIDPSTGGTVDPDDGSIHDSNTGQYIGLADRYLNATVCAVPAKN